jgi:AraC-like DNA-binding protein/mannose-6-phosphate isomerase-like protein (cupin superfamily)
MVKSKKSYKSRINPRKREASKAIKSSGGSFDITPHVRASSRPCRDTFSLVEPQINAEGVHVWPFDVSCPVDILFMTTHDRQRVRMNRHGYFEVLYLCSGSGVCHIQDRLLPFNEGDLAVIGSTLYHRIECCSDAPLTIVALFFEPQFICCDGASDSAEYLAPFMLQDEKFPHVVAAKTGAPRQVLDMMLRIQSELPAASPRARLAIKTYLKMMLMNLVNEYTPYAGTVETFRRQQRDLDRLRPLFRHLAENCGNAVQVHQAARVCGMSESHFMSFFKKVTGLSFVAYFNHFRIERAQTLLSKTDETLVSISQQVGFCDQSYFGAVFRKIVGMTPAAYRSRCRADIVPDLQRGAQYHRVNTPCESVLGQRVLN